MVVFARVALSRARGFALAGFVDFALVADFFVARFAIPVDLPYLQTLSVQRRTIHRQERMKGFAPFLQAFC